ncbi:MAG TPA: hypothetical protein VFI70_08240 [Nitrososphaeraceae archaeon]|nr:hypothetical protein [Nitrososphaeraceae archaeon]
MIATRTTGHIGLYISTKTPEKLRPEVAKMDSVKMRIFWDVYGTNAAFVPATITAIVIILIFQLQIKLINYLLQKDIPIQTFELFGLRLTGC